MIASTSSFARFCALAVLLSAIVTSLAFAVSSRPVPLIGTASGSVVSVNPTPDGVLLTIHASGRSTLLGRFERVEELLLDPATGTFTGSIVFVAASHDELRVTMVGSFVSPTDAAGTYTVVGGTGRFEGASGSAAFEAFTPDGVQASVRFAGTISGFGD